MTINCEEACINGCVLGDQCPHLGHVDAVSKFISETSLDEMLAIAEEAVRKKMLVRMAEPPQWILPDQD